MPATKNESEDGRWQIEDGSLWFRARRYLPSSIFYLRLLLVVLALGIAGCAPPGPRAFLKGKKLLDHGDYPRAVAQLKIATSLLVTNAQAWNYYGVALQHNGQYDEAAAAYQNALKFDRDLVEAHYNFGCLWMEQGKFADAKTEFTAYTLRRSNTPEGWLKLGTAQLRNGDLLLAEKSFSTALSLSQNNAEALNGLGLARIARDRPEDAAKFFSAAVDAHPDFAPARLNLAVVDDQYLRDQKGALENYHAYLAMTPRPENWDGVNALVNVLEPPPKVTAPSPPPKPVAVVPPTPPPAPHPALTRTNPPAVRTNSPAIRTNPVVQVGRATTSEPPNVVSTDNPRPAPPRNTAPVHVTPPAPKSNTAVNPDLAWPPPAPKPAPRPSRAATPAITFPRYVYLSPHAPAAGNRKAAASVFAEGRRYEQGQQYADALSSYQTAAAIDPGWFEAQYNYGVLAFRQQDYAHALAADEMALAIQPDSMDARYNFALALKGAGYAPDAVNELKKILEEHPDDVRAHLALGNLYAQQLGDNAQARQHYTKVLALDPTNPRAPYIQYWLSGNPP